jgi:hypothetical protein
MKRFAIAAAVAAIIGLGTAGTADAQYHTQYTTITPGGVVTSGTMVMPGAYKNYSNLYSPFYGTVQRQSYGGDIFGNSYGRTYGYNTWTGYGYRSGFYQPNPFITPYGGYNYGFYGRRW